MPRPGNTGAQHKGRSAARILTGQDALRLRSKTATLAVRPGLVVFDDRDAATGDF